MFAFNKLISKWGDILELAAQTIRNLSTSENFNFSNININRSNQAIKQLNLIHSDDDGFITVAIKDKDHKWHQHHYKKEELEINIFKLLGFDIDTYMSINSFYVPKRSPECIRHINSLYIDIDNHSKGKVNVDSILYFLEEDFFNREVPTPNLVIKTGRGLALYWILEHLPKQGLPLWTLVQEELYKKIKDIETYIKNVQVDPSALDVSRVFRISGSKNTKSNTLANIYSYTDEKYRLDEIIEEFLPDLKIVKKKKEKKNTKLNNKQKKIAFFYTTYSLHYARLMDIVKLQELRQGNCTGQRELICFLYRYYNCLYVKNYDLAIQNTLEFNSKFTEPLSYTEVIKSTKKAEKGYEEWLKNESVIKNGKVYKRGGYNYSNKKLIELLKITPLEQKELETIIGKEEKYRRNNIRRKIERRNNEGLTMREQQKAEKIQAIHNLKHQGYKLREIAEKLNISIDTVKKYLYKI